MVETFPENTEECPEIWMYRLDFKGDGDGGFSQPALWLVRRIKQMKPRHGGEGRSIKSLFLPEYFLAAMPMGQVRWVVKGELVSGLIKAVIDFLGENSGHCVGLGKGGLEIMGGEGWFGNDASMPGWKPKVKPWIRKWMDWWLGWSYGVLTHCVIWYMWSSFFH